MADEEMVTGPEMVEEAALIDNSHINAAAAPAEEPSSAVDDTAALPSPPVGVEEGTKPEGDVYKQQEEVVIEDTHHGGVGEVVGGKKIYKRPISVTVLLAVASFILNCLSLFFSVTSRRHQCRGS